MTSLAASHEFVWRAIECACRRIANPSGPSVAPAMPSVGVVGEGQPARAEPRPDHRARALPGSLQRPRHAASVSCGDRAARAADQHRVAVLRAAYQRIDGEATAVSRTRRHRSDTAARVEHQPCQCSSRGMHVDDSTGVRPVRRSVRQRRCWSCPRRTSVHGSRAPIGRVPASTPEVVRTPPRGDRELRRSRGASSPCR